MKVKVNVIDTNSIILCGSYANQLKMVAYAHGCSISTGGWETALCF